MSEFSQNADCGQQLADAIGTSLEFADQIIALMQPALPLTTQQIAEACWSESDGDVLRAITAFAGIAWGWLDQHSRDVIGRDISDSRAQAFLLKNIPAANQALGSGGGRNPRRLAPFGRVSLHKRAVDSDARKRASRRKYAGASVARFEVNPRNGTTQLLNADKLSAAALKLLQERNSDLAELRINGQPWQWATPQIALEWAERMGVALPFIDAISRHCDPRKRFDEQITPAMIDEVLGEIRKAA